MNLKHLFFVGIGGSGMSSLALFCKSKGWQVSGNDRQDSKTTKELTQAGIHVFLGDLDDIATAHYDAVIRSSAVAFDHPTVLAAQNNNVAVLHRSDLLALLTADHRTVSVCGTHGKSTTSGMLSFLLTEVGLEPSYILGASFADNAPAYRVGKSDLLVIEADESDESYSKYECEGFILTNLAEDHLDRYGSLNGIIQSFKNYCESTKIRRWLVYNADNEAASNVASVYSGKRISFGQTGIPSFQLRSHSQGDFISTFSWSENLKNHDSSLPMPGIHNIENALAALAAASALGVDVDRAAHALTRFPGMDKRLKRHFDNGQCIVFEDYAHNPGKIDACLRGLKEAYPGHKIVCVFQPHRFSRLHTTYDLFLRSFTSADHVYVLPVYSAGETSAEAHEISELTKNISHFSKIRATVAEDLQRAVTQLEYLLNEKAVVVTVGAGDVGYVASELARRWS